MRLSTALRATGAILVAFVAACELGTEPGGPEVAEIRVEPTTAAIPVEGSLQLTATVSDDAGAPLDVDVFWASEDSTLARVSRSGMVTGRAIGTVRVAASAGGRSALATISVQPKPVATVSVTPAESRLVVGAQVTLSAVARDDDGAALSGRAVAWSTGDAEVATVNAEGRVTAVAPGNTQIRATIEGKVGTATIEVVTTDVARVVITPSSAALRIGETQQFTAAAFDRDDNELTDRDVEWSTSDEEIVAISPTGLATAVAVGAAEITATVDGTSATVPVGVGLTPVATVTVTPASLELEVGEREELTAVLRAEDGTVLSGRSVNWSTSSASIASVNASGEVTAVAPGTVTITATSEGKKGTAQVRVVPQPVATVEVLPASFTLVLGDTARLQALTRAANGSTLTGRSVTWESSDNAVATVNTSGKVTAVATGTATITATSEGKSGSATVTVQTEPVATVEVAPTTANVFVGATRPLTATLRDAHGVELEGRFVSWSTDDARVAVVDPTGVVAGVSPGRARITASSEGKTATAEITVLLRPVNTVAVTPATATVVVGGTRQLTATLKAENGETLTGRTVEWSSSNAGVAAVSGTGLVTAVSAGGSATGTTVTITARSEGKTGTAKITVIRRPVARVVVTPTTATLTVDDSLQLQVRLEGEEGTVLTDRTVIWSSSDNSIATVSSSGRVAARTPGTATITATSEGKSGKATITVQPKTVATVTIEPPSWAMNVGDEKQFTATARASDGTVLEGHEVSWSSAAPTIVEISETTGLATALSVGSTTIRATIAGKVGQAPVAVGLPPVDTILVSPPSLALVVDENASLTASVRDADGDPIPERAVVWSSNAPDVATVNSSTGAVHAVGEGTATITASSGGKSTAVPVTVSPKPVATVTVAPADTELVLGKTATLTATLRASDGTILDRPVDWASSNDAKATVSDGLVTAVDTGTVTITATSEGKSGTAQVRVIPVPVASVEVEPAIATLVVDSVHQFIARALDSDGLELSDREVEWSSDNEAVATVSSDGKVTALAVGTATIQATVEGKIGSATVEVTPKPVASVEVEPTSVTLEVGETTELVATVRAGDGTPLERIVDWGTSSDAIATVSTAGLVTAVGPGTATITATSEGVDGTATVTVILPPVATVLVTPGADTLFAGETVTLAAETRDADGTVLTGRGITWETSNAAVATVDASLVTALIAGVATITAESEGKTGTSIITVRPAPVALLLVSGDGQNGVSGGTLPEPLVVKALDHEGAPVVGAIVHWSTADGSITPPQAPTALDGTTSAIWTLGTESAAVPVAWAEIEGLSPVQFTAFREDPL